MEVIVIQKSIKKSFSHSRVTKKKPVLKVFATDSPNTDWLDNYYSLHRLTTHSCQPAELVIPNGGGFGREVCPLKLKKMAHMHRNGK